MGHRHILLAVPALTAALLMPLPPALALARQAQPSLGVTGRALMRDLQRAGEDVASETLAQWIIASRGDALRAGVTAIPDGMRARLKGYFPEELLARVRYRIGSDNELSLPANAFKGRTVAITLGEVILFRSDSDAKNDARLWAHELTHVQQYDHWGLRGFARRYALNYRAVEAEAEAGAAAFARFASK